MAFGMPLDDGTLNGVSAGPASIELGGDRHLHRVVMAVVTALHLDDQVPVR